jgi:hypothetical protein
MLLPKAPLDEYLESGYQILHVLSHAILFHLDDGDKIGSGSDRW